jgi:hypothetical protein
VIEHSTPTRIHIAISIMADSIDPSTGPTATDLTQSGVTITSDSENYGQSPADEDGISPSSSGGSAPLILYSPPTVWGLLRGAGINLFLPFINGLMLGFGELFAHELAFRLGWSGTKVGFRFNLEFANRWRCFRFQGDRLGRESRYRMIQWRERGETAKR